MSGERGFTLLEALVAFTILAFSLLAILNLFRRGGDMAQSAAEYQRAGVVARSTLAAVGVTIPLKPGESSGVQNREYRWSVQIRPHADAPASDGSGIVLYEIDAVVTWGKPERLLDLKTMRLGTSSK